MVYVCPEIKEGRIARAREKGSDGKGYQDTKCDAEMRGRERR